MNSREECVAIVRQLWPFLDDALPEAWQERVIAHLASCESCRSHYDFEREFVHAVRSAGQEIGTDAPAMQDRVLRALAAHGFAPG